MPERIANHPAAKAEWDRLAAILSAQGVFTPQFGDLLAMFAETSAQLEQQLAEFARMNRQSVVVADLDGCPGAPAQPHHLEPDGAGAEVSQELMLRLCAEFGVSPASVAKVTRDDPHADDAAERFLASRPPAPWARMKTSDRDRYTSDSHRRPMAWCASQDLTPDRYHRRSRKIAK